MREIVNTTQVEGNLISTLKHSVVRTAVKKTFLSAAILFSGHLQFHLSPESQKINRVGDIDLLLMMVNQHTSMLILLGISTTIESTMQCFYPTSGLWQRSVGVQVFSRCMHRVMMGAYSTACRDITCGVLQRSIVSPNLLLILKLLGSIVRQCVLTFQQYVDAFKSMIHLHQMQSRSFSNSS